MALIPLWWKKQNLKEAVIFISQSKTKRSDRGLEKGLLSRCKLRAKSKGEQAVAHGTTPSSGSPLLSFVPIIRET